MRNYRQILCLLAAVLLVLPLAARPDKKHENVREYWCNTAYRIAFPVLDALSRQELKEKMPVEVCSSEIKGRENFTYLEALGRTLCGLAPWLELPDEESREGKMRKELLDLAHKAIRNAVDPDSKDCMNFNRSNQPLVDAAFLAQGFLRSPKRLWGELDEETRKLTLEALRKTRAIRPNYSNWLMFSATVEAFFLSVGEPWDVVRIDYALRKHKEWYVGDGAYGDGPQFAWDYYNSFVIQPMLVDVYRVLHAHKRCKKAEYDEMMKRSRRYAEVLERFIAPDGTFPAVGRSLVYRMGCMHSLAQMSLMHNLPVKVSPAQVRAAMTASMHRIFDHKDTFDKEGWLQLGFVGHQPEVAEYYISTGSLYLTTTGFLALGLPATDPFWTGKDEAWTAVKAWSGGDLSIDHSIR